MIEARLDNPADASAGKVYFEQKCSSCHSAAGLASIAKKYDYAALKAQILKPQALEASPSWTLDRLTDAKTAAARQRHGALLENYSGAEVGNLTVYLQSMK